MKTKQSGHPASIFLSIGSIGLLIAFGLNLVGLFVFGKPAAVFFSGEWWSQWFPLYGVWTSFLLLGVIQRRWKPATHTPET